MARSESDREDLMREATALRQRVELRVAEATEPVVAGFHDDGRLSIYFGQETALHFDAASRLRRAYADEHLYRAQGQTLARLTRSRSEGRSELLRHDLTEPELAQLLDRFHTQLQNLETSLRDGTARVLREVPEGSEVALQLQSALASIVPSPIRIAPALKK